MRARRVVWALCALEPPRPDVCGHCGKVVQARETVGWQAPVGPSDNGIRGSMHASAPDERKTPVTGVLIFVGGIAQDFGISPRILTYQVRLAYQPGF